MSEPWTMAILVGCLVAGFALSVLWRRKPRNWLPRLLLLGAASAFFFANAIANPEQRFASLLFALLAAGFVWKSVRPETGGA